MNQIVRHRDQHNTQLKQNSSWSHPHRIAQSVQSDQSTWASSPGYGAIGVAVAAVLVVGVVFGFGTPMGGSWWWLALVLGLTIVASLGLGFAIASLASTDAQVVQFSMLALLFTIFFSGLVVSLDRIAEGVRYVAFLVPATAGTSALHDVMFRGRAPALHLVAILAVYTVLALLLARQGLRRQQVA